MAESKAAVQTNGKTEPKARPRRALLVELDPLAVRGRDVLFETVQGLLKEKHASFDAMTFSKTCLDPDLERALEALPDRVGASSVDGSKFREDVQSAMSFYVQSEDVNILEGLPELLRDASAAGFALGFVTTLEEEEARPVLDRILPEGVEADLFSSADEQRAVAGADVWLRAAKTLMLEPRKCAALVSGADACRAALTAGMRCIALPDVYTEFQDFSGADRVAEALSADLTKEILEVE